MVSPSLRILLLVPDAVSFDRPFSRAFPFHHSSTLIGTQNDDELASSPESRIPAVHGPHVCGRVNPRNPPSSSRTLTRHGHDPGRQQDNRKDDEKNLEPPQHIAQQRFYSRQTPATSRIPPAPPEFLWVSPVGRHGRVWTEGRKSSRDFPPRTLEETLVLGLDARISSDLLTPRLRGGPLIIVVGIPIQSAVLAIWGRRSIGEAG